MQRRQGLIRQGVNTETQIFKDNRVSRKSSEPDTRKSSEPETRKSSEPERTEKI